MATPSQTAALRQEGSTSELCSLGARQPPAVSGTSQGAALCCPVFGASAPQSWAECECLLGAFLTTHSMAGVIQRRAEASAATETTMKRKQNSKNSPFINQLNCR